MVIFTDAELGVPANGPGGGSGVVAIGSVSRSARYVTGAAYHINTHVQTNYEPGLPAIGQGGRGLCPVYRVSYWVSHGAVAHCCTAVEPPQVVFGVFMPFACQPCFS